MTPEEFAQRDLDDLAKRQWHRRMPKKVGNVVADLMALRGYARVRSANELNDAWNEAAGKLAGHTRPGNISRGVLEVYVDSSAAMQELTFQKRSLLKKVKELLPSYKINSLRFRIGAID